MGLCIPQCPLAIVCLPSYDIIDSVVKQAAAAAAIRMQSTLENLDPALLVKPSSPARKTTL